MHTRFDDLPWLTILAAALLLCGCSAGIPYFQPTAPPTPTYYIWNPSVTPTHTPTNTPTSTPRPTFTPTPSPTPADLPLLSDGQNIFRLLSAGARNDWEIYGEYFQRLAAREGQVFYIVELELTSGTNPLDLLLGQGALGRALYLSDERQQLYPAVQVLRSENRAMFVFQGLPVSYSGSLQLHFLTLPPTTFIPGLDLSILQQQAAPHALATSLALAQPPPLALNCAQPVDLTILPTLAVDGMSQVPAGKTFRVQLAPLGEGGTVAVDRSDGDGLLRVDTRMVQGRSGSTGLIFGLDDAGQNGYSLQVDTSGRWAFSRTGINGDWKMLRDFSPSPAVQPGAATNRLTVVRQNSFVALYANDIPLTSAFPLDITGSRDGLGIRSPGSETLIDEFSRYQRCQLAANSPLPIQLASDPPGQWPAETPLLLEYTWSANTLAQAEQFAARASIRLQVDGITAANPQKNWGRAAPLGGVFSSGERSVIRWQALINPLPPGRHHILFRLSLLQPVTSGLDRDADGKLDIYGPGLIVNQDFNLEVK